MADRTVSAELRLNVDRALARMQAVTRAARQLNRELNRTGQQGNDFQEFEQGAQRLERQLRRLMEVQRQQAQRQQQSSQETQRGTQETERNTEETRRNTDETSRNSDEVRRNTQQARQNRQETQQQNRAREQARDSVGRFTRQTDENTRSQDRNRRALAQGIRGLKDQGSALESAIAAAGLLAVAETSAAVAVGSFGLLAAPSIGKVVGAQEDLAANWETLTPLQRVSALQVSNLADRYEELAHSFEPQALGAFSTGLGIANALLPKFAGLATATAGDVQGLLNRIGAFATGPEMDAFINNAKLNAPTALHELGTAATTTGSLALRLATDLTPVGLSFLSVANGALGMVNGLAHVNPALAQLAITGLLLRRPLTGLVTGVTSLTGRMRGGLAATRGLTVGQRALQVVARAGPAAFVAAGIGLAFLAVRAHNAKNSTDELINSMRIEARASGNNLTGHQRFAAQLETTADTLERRLTVEMGRYTEQERRSSDVTSAHNRKINELRDQYRRTQDSLEQQRATMKRVETGAGLLADRYGITRDQALQLATASGVDLTTAMGKNGRLTGEAATKINNYQLSVEAAKDPTREIGFALDNAANSALAMKDRLAGLSTALDAAFNPSLQVFQVTTQMRQGFRDLAEQITAAKGRMDGNSESSLRLRQAFAGQLGTVRDLATATFNKTKSMDAARAAVAQQLPLLYALAGRNKDARAQVDALAQSLGINTNGLVVSRTQFVQQATAMLGSRRQAELLWQAYQRLTASQRAGSGALGGYIQRTQTAAAQARIQALRTDGAAGAQQVYNAKIRESLPVLYALAGNNAKARAQVDALARSTGNSSAAMNVSRRAFISAASAMGIARDKAAQLWREMNKIKSRSVKINVNAKGLWINAHDPERRFPGLARAQGGPIPAIGPESSEAYDSVPALLRVNEHVWTPEEVRAVGGHASMLRMRAAARRGQLQGFATGGPVNFGGRGTPAHDVGVVMRPVYSGMDGLVDKVGDEMAALWKRFMASGGPVVSAARTQLGVPYVWGGTAWNRGLDCSGLTSGAWQRGAGVWIGRTTYAQFPASSHLSGPKPGALGFPHMGHVVLASGRGTIIEAPYTGANVREVGINRNYEWRWPNAAPFAKGGAVTPDQQRIGRKFLATDSPSAIRDAKLLGIAGDPGGLGIPGYATGGRVQGERHTAQVAPRGGPMRLWAEPETGGEAYIPLSPAKRARSTEILGQVARQFGMGLMAMGDGGIIGYADGGTDGLSISEVLSDWTSLMVPASKSDLTSARSARATQARQYADAKRALAAARRSHSHTRIGAAERKLRKEREDLTKATQKLADVERRYKIGAQAPATQLGSALTLRIRNTGAFISNLTKLSDRGFGVLARHLLAAGDDQAEKLAASAVKLSDKSLRGLQGNITKAEQQEETLKQLPNILTARSAVRSGQARTWQELLKATGLTPDDLSAALRGMKTDLLKTASGKTIWAQMIADGYAGGGWISGPAGTDRVPIRATVGEYMVSAGQARRRAALVEAINGGASDAILRRLIPASPNLTTPAVRGGDGASAPMIGELHVNHVPGYSTPQDVVHAIRQVELTQRYHRRR